MSTALLPARPDSDPEPDPAGSAAGAARPRPGRRRAKHSPPTWLRLPAFLRGAPGGARREPPSAYASVGPAAMTIVASLMLAFCICLGPLGYLQHVRSQQLARAQLRSELALGTAPVGQGDADQRLLDLGDPVASLDIPAIGLHEVILEGTSSSVLSKGPGHRRDTPLPGQAGTSVVMGRKAAFGGPFRSIDSLTPGAVLTTHTGQGIETFRVSGVRHAGDRLPPAVAAGAARLTLLTATGPAYLPSGVVYVDAELTSQTQPSAARRLIYADLPQSQRAMGTDDTKWVQIMLWSQLLLVCAVAAVMAWTRWGRWQTWIVAVPALGGCAIGLSGCMIDLLPNLM